MADPGLIRKLEREKDETLELLRQLVVRESPSTDKALVDELVSFLHGRVEENGLAPQVERRCRAGDILWAEWEGGRDGKILVLCHIDTVWAKRSLERNPFRTENGKVFGPGIYDMKAGVCATLKVQEFLKKGWIKPRRRVRFLYTTDEETGSHESRRLIEEFARRSDCVLVTEPPLPGGALKTFRKGVGDYILKIRGKSAHAGVEPDRGVNAVVELAHQILGLQALSDPGRGTTVTVTVAEGGTRENVVPDAAEARIDVRFRAPEEGERVDQALKTLRPFLPGAEVRTEGGINRPPMVRTQETVEIFESARRLAAPLGLELREGETGGASDGNFTAALGVPTLDGLGIDGEGAHAWHEHIRESALAPGIALLAALVEGL